MVVGVFDHYDPSYTVLTSESDFTCVMLPALPVLIKQNTP